MTINTLSQRARFSYKGSCEKGFYLECQGEPFVSADLIRRALDYFRGQTVPGGFHPGTPTGFGDWLQLNSALTTQQAAKVAAVMVHERKIDVQIDGRMVLLQFPENIAA